jgi:hypothetical protein
MAAGDPFNFVGKIDAVFFKILATNDNSSKHGVVVPTGAYEFIPQPRVFPSKPTENDRLQFPLVWEDGKEHRASYLYYERYPERRFGALRDRRLNDTSQLRLMVLGRRQGDVPSFEGRIFLESAANFRWACRALGIPDAFRGAWGVNFNWGRPRHGGVEHSEHVILKVFDRLTAKGFVPGISRHPSAVGLTFEEACGIKPNSDSKADIDGVEIKASIAKRKGKKTSGDEDLFLKEPDWTSGFTGRELVEKFGYRDAEDRQGFKVAVSARGPASRGVSLKVVEKGTRIAVVGGGRTIGSWGISQLDAILRKKLRDTAFVAAEIRKESTGPHWFHYRGLAWCSDPSVENLVRLIEEGVVWVEFRMHISHEGKWRNHGTQFRIHSDALEQLFTTVLQLRWNWPD